MKSIVLERLSWPVAVILIFGVVYACSLALVYVEGDDAASIAYHAMGRNAELQRPYASYQAGADLLLKLLPANEPVLRVAAISLTSLAMVACLVLMLALVFDWLGNLAVERKWLVVLVVLLAVPEFFYLGLVYQPPVIGVCLMLVSHLVLRRALREQEVTGLWGRRFWLKALLAAGLLGAGGAIRWNLVIYGWLIFWDWVLGLGRKPASGWRDYLGKAALASVWGGVAAGAWLLAVAASGYGPKDIYAFQRFAVKLAASDSEWRVLLGSALSLFTPALVLLSLWGLVFLLRKQMRLAVFAGISALPVLPLIMISNPKQYLWFFPVLVLCVTAGCIACFASKNDAKWGYLVRAGMAFLLLLPWIVGVRATYGDTAWGPGFEMRPYDREKRAGSSLSLSLGAGAAMPTPEGPRPSWGHGAVLLGGEWRRFCLAAAAEHTAIVQTAAQEGLPILVLQGTGGQTVCVLTRLGFTTRDRFDSGHAGPFASTRRFVSREGQAVALLRLDPKPPEFIRDARIIQEVITAGGSENVVATGYPANLRALHKAAPAALRKIGPVSAVVSLKGLQAEAVADSSQGNPSSGSTGTR